MEEVDFIKKNNRTIIPIRIREARISRGKSLSELADDIGVTKQAVSKYELGTMNVTSSSLLKISEALNFPVDFFFKPKEDTTQNYRKSPTFFRSLKVSKKVQDVQKQKVEFIHEIVSLLSNYIDFPKVDLVDFEKNISDKSFDDDIIENIALGLRNHWSLGTAPIGNLSSLLLRKGFIISRVELETTKVDAYSRWIGVKPYIILGADKNCGVRSRFDLAHELGHLILHSHLEDEELKVNHNQIEHEANRFASAFLMPCESFSKDVYSISLDSFIVIKQKWKVSIAAIIRRCYDLNLITEQQYTNLNKYLSIKKWRTKEPLDDIITFENPTMIKEAFDLLIENGIISATEILDKIALNDYEIEQLCFMPDDYFKKLIHNNTKPKLKLIR